MVNFNGGSTGTSCDCKMLFSLVIIALNFVFFVFSIMAVDEQIESN